jgi:hypothetical protein
MTETDELILPTKKVVSNRVNPKRLVVYSKPKAGKTTAFAGLDNNLIIDLENGSDYLDALKVKASCVADLKKIGEAIKKAGKPYKYITVDTVTALEDMVGELAIKLYQKTPMGARYSGDNILTLPNGAGYFYIREAFFQVLDYIDTLAENIILAGHIKDKAVDDKGELVMPANIDLTGKIKSLICANADAIGYIYRKGGQMIVSFKSNDEVTCGARPEHLSNKEIILSEIQEDGSIRTYWDRVYIK